jgi:hypothetical protein
VLARGGRSPLAQLRPGGVVLLARVVLLPPLQRGCADAQPRHSAFLLPLPRECAGAQPQLAAFRLLLTRECVCARSLLLLQCAVFRPRQPPNRRFVALLEFFYSQPRPLSQGLVFPAQQSEVP